MESHFDRQRRAIRLAAEGINLISESVRILSDEKQYRASNNIVLRTLQQLILSQFPSLEPEVSGSGPNVCESDLPPNRYAPPPPLEEPAARANHGAEAKGIPSSVMDAVAWLRTHHVVGADTVAAALQKESRATEKPQPEPEAGPQQEPPTPAMTPPQREITSSLGTSYFEAIRIRLRREQEREKQEREKQEPRWRE